VIWTLGCAESSGTSQQNQAPAPAPVPILAPPVDTSADRSATLGAPAPAPVPVSVPVPAPEDTAAIQQIAAGQQQITQQQQQLNQQEQELNQQFQNQQIQMEAQNCANTAAQSFGSDYGYQFAASEGTYQAIEPYLACVCPDLCQTLYANDSGCASAGQSICTSSQITNIIGSLGG
jgi:hypothetical protein